MLTLLVATTLFLPSKDASFDGGAFRAEDGAVLLSGDEWVTGRLGPRGEDQEYGLLKPNPALVSWESELLPGELGFKLRNMPFVESIEVARQYGKSWLRIETTRVDGATGKAVIAKQGTYRIQIRTNYAGVGSKRIDGIELSGTALLDSKK